MSKRPSFLLKLKRINTARDEDKTQVVFVLMDSMKEIKLTIKGKELANSLGFKDPGSEFKLVVHQVSQTQLEVTK